MNKYKKTGYALRFDNLPTYYTWRSMHERCTRKTDRCYYLYGGRGIRVCVRWRSFKNFFEDMGSRPEGHAIDRIDNNKGYSKNNCRWISKLESARNKRHIINYMLNGKSMNLKQICESKGVKYSTIYKRIKKYGWTAEEAIKEKVGKWERINK